MTRTCNSLAAIALLAAAAACGIDDPSDIEADTAALDPEGQIVVMTQNQYLGADLRPLLATRDEQSFQTAIRDVLDQVAANRFRVRAFALALQIAVVRPDVVALQEVFDFTLNGAHGPAPWRDHLADTLDALATLGSDYQVAAQVQNMSTTLPADLDSNGTREAQVRITDRDVILVRRGIAATPAPFPARCARPSGDGCKFQIAPFAPLPSGQIALDRGYVGVDLSVNGRDYRIVNTQLEQRDIDPSDPLSASFQSMQASELFTLIRVSQSGPRTVIVLGDLASRPEDELIIFGSLLMVPPRHQAITGGFKDVWPLATSAVGNTCCQPANLRNFLPRLDRRVDYIWSSDQPVDVRADVIGDTFVERVLLGGWASDHGTLFARVRYPIGPAQPVLPPPAPATESVLHEGT